MAILILNRSLPHEKSPYETWLRSLNEHLILLTAEELVGDYGNKGFKEIIGFKNYSNNGCVELTALELSKKYTFRSVIATAERDLLRAAKIRDVLGIDGQSYNSALAFRDKVLMKSLVSEKGLLVPEFKRLYDAIDLITFINKNGFPVVVKPVDGAASVNTFVIHNQEDLRKYLSSNTISGMEVEKFVKGDMYHIDGLIIRNKLIFIWPSKYLNGCLAYQDGIALGSYLLEYGTPLYKRLVDFTQRVLAALPTPENTAFHAEVFHTADDDLVLCEIASRIGGGKIEESISNAFRLNLRKAMVQAQCGIHVDTALWKTYNSTLQSYTGWLIIPPRAGILTKLPSKYELPDWVVLYDENGVIGKEYENPSRSTDSIATFLVSGKSPKIVEERLQYVHDWFQSSVVWRPLGHHSHDVRCF